MLAKEAAAQRAAALHKLMLAEYEAQAFAQGAGSHLTSGAAAVRLIPPLIQCSQASLLLVRGLFVSRGAIALGCLLGLSTPSQPGQCTLL